MRRLIVLLAFVASACGGDSPVAPIAPAVISASGNLTVTGCVITGAFFNCADYSGAATNTGSGCAVNVRGVVTTVDAVTKNQTGTSGWSYGAMVRPGERIAYAGKSILVQGPLSGGWAYTTTLAWDSMKCP